MRRATAILLAIAAILATGCGSSSNETPAACLVDSGAYLHALDRAPAAVRLGGEVPISDCLPENQEAGALATVGAAMVVAATKLNTEARADPGGPAAARLGYLLGAADHAAETTEGIHAELIRRLTVAARYSPEGPLPRAFYRQYRRGYAAGRTDG